MNMKLSPPWINFYNEIKDLFEQDSEIKIKFNEEVPEINLFVDNARKADALAALLPETKEFGNVTMKINVVPANKTPSKLDLMLEAFLGNPALAYVWSSDTSLGTFQYAVFENKVVQYFNDDLQDINGNRSTLYQDIAKDVFGEATGINFCTESIQKDLTKPLGEWP
jgi:hypothetical protein